MEEAHR
jgi:ACT domain-containing protein